MTDARVRPVTVECQRCQAEVPAAELEPGKSVCRDCWSVVNKEMMDALETTRERRGEPRREDEKMKERAFRVGR